MNKQLQPIESENNHLIRDRPIKTKLKKLVINKKINTPKSNIQALTPYQ